MKSRFWIFTSAVLAMSIFPAVVLGDGALSVDVQPAFCTEPCAVRMLVSVDPHEADRELIVEADSSRFYRSSLIQLDGDAEPAVHTRMWKGYQQDSTRFAPR